MERWKPVIPVSTFLSQTYQTHTTYLPLLEDPPTSLNGKLLELDRDARRASGGPQSSIYSAYSKLECNYCLLSLVSTYTVCYIYLDIHHTPQTTQINIFIIHILL